MNSICVFCGSNAGHDPRYRAAAEDLGRLLAERQIDLVYGGGNVGLMGALADASLAAGGTVVGVIPEALLGKEVAGRQAGVGENAHQPDVAAAVDQFDVPFGQQAAERLGCVAVARIVAGAGAAAL